MNESEFETKTAYEILGVSENETYTNIKNKFKSLAIYLHPNVDTAGQSNYNEFMQASLAYAMLKRDSIREIYDNALKAAKRKCQ